MTRSSVLRALILFSAILLIGSLMPISFKTALHTDRRIIHPLLHLAAFAVLTALTALLAKSRYRALVAPFAAIFFGFVLEFLEHTAYHQILEVSDVLLDSCGAAVGYLVYAVLGTGYGFPPKPVGKSSAS